MSSDELKFHSYGLKHKILLYTFVNINLLHNSKKFWNSYRMEDIFKFYCNLCITIQAIQLTIKFHFMYIS